MILRIIGDGGFAREAAHTARALGFTPELVGIEDEPGVPAGALVYVALGEPLARSKAWARLRHVHQVALVHPSGECAQIPHPEGCYVGQFALVAPGAQLGRGVLVNYGASVAHDALLEDFVSVAPGARINGRCIVGARTLIGSNAALLPGVRVGCDCVVGMGAVVVRDVPDGAIVVGNPARRTIRCTR